MINSLDEKYMRRCFKLALKGKGKTTPNPMVGCVVLNKDGKVISEGYHKEYGQNHAERDALLKLKNGEAEGGTLYVNLEPCSHFGKTPPCADLIIENRIKRVVIGMKDINPIVDGISKLKKAGIEVDFALEKEAEFINRVFIKNMRDKLPYVVLKTAVTMDGKIATKNGDSKWITSEKSRKLVYRLRKEFNCIMTSSNTVIADNPTMKHKFKCILDKDLRVSEDSKIMQQGNIYVASKENTPLIKGNLDIKSVLKNLYKKGICTIFVEAGGILAGNMLKNNLVDEVFEFIAPKIVNDNSAKSCFDGDCIDLISKSKELDIYEVKCIGPDILIKGLVKNK